MTISWAQKASQYLLLADRERQIAKMLPMRTHGRKVALQNARFYEHQSTRAFRKSQEQSA